MRDERTPKDLCGEATCWDDAIESDVNFRFIVGDEREPYHFTTSGDLKKSIFFLEIADYVLKKTCVSTSQKVMEKQTLLLWFATALLLLLSSKESSGSFFSSLQFTRDSLMSFSSGSERTVQILTPKKTTKTVMKKVPGVRPTKAKKKTKVTKYSVIHKSGWGAGPKRAPRTEPPPTKLVPVTETVVTYQNKRKVYRRRSSPSNKFLEAINDIERAVANAKASGIRFSARTLNKLKALVERAIRSKSYKYARQVRLKTKDILNVCNRLYFPLQCSLYPALPLSVLCFSFFFGSISDHRLSSF